MTRPGAGTSTMTISELHSLTPNVTALGAAIDYVERGVGRGAAFFFARPRPPRRTVMGGMVLPATTTTRGSGVPSMPAAAAVVAPPSRSSPSRSSPSRTPAASSSSSPSMRRAAVVVPPWSLLTSQQQRPSPSRNQHRNNGGFSDNDVQEEMPSPVLSSRGPSFRLLGSLMDDKVDTDGGAAGTWRDTDDADTDAGNNNNTNADDDDGGTAGSIRTYSEDGGGNDSVLERRLVGDGGGGGGGDLLHYACTNGTNGDNNSLYSESICTYDSMTVVGNLIARWRRFLLSKTRDHNNNNKVIVDMLPAMLGGSTAGAAWYTQTKRQREYQDFLDRQYGCTSRKKTVFFADNVGCFGVGCGEDDDGDTTEEDNSTSCVSSTKSDGSNRHDDYDGQLEQTKLDETKGKDVVTESKSLPSGYYLGSSSMACCFPMIPDYLIDDNRDNYQGNYQDKDQNNDRDIDGTTVVTDVVNNTSSFLKKSPTKAPTTKQFDCIGDISKNRWNSNSCIEETSASLRGAFLPFLALTHCPQTFHTSYNDRRSAHALVQSVDDVRMYDSRRGEAKRDDKAGFDFAGPMIRLGSVQHPNLRSFFQMSSGLRNQKANELLKIPTPKLHPPHVVPSELYESPVELTLGTRPSVPRTEDGRNSCKSIKSTQGTGPGRKLRFFGRLKQHSSYSAGNKMASTMAEI